MRSMLALRTSVSSNIKKFQAAADSKPVKRSGLIAIASELRDDLRSAIEQVVPTERVFKRHALLSLQATEGLLNGLSNKLYSLQDFRSDLKIVKKSYEVLEDSLPSAGATPEEIPALANTAFDGRGKTMEEALRVLRQRLDKASSDKEPKLTDSADTKEDAENARLISALERVRSMGADLPSSLKGMYGVSKLPIIAIFKVNISKVISQEGQRAASVNRNFTKFHALRRLGLDFVPIDDYLILLNQAVLMVRRKDAIAYLQDLKDANDKDHKAARSKARADYAGRLAGLQKRYDAFHAAKDKYSDQISALTGEISALRARYPADPEVELSKVQLVLKERAAELAAERSGLEDARNNFLQVNSEMNGVSDPSELPSLIKETSKKRIVADTSFLEADSLRMKGSKHLQAENERDYARMVVAGMNESLPVEYAFVTDMPIRNPKNADIVLFWIMPKRILEELHKQGWANLLKWSLAFDPAMENDVESIAAKRKAQGDKFRKQLGKS